MCGRLQHLGEALPASTGTPGVLISLELAVERLQVFWLLREST
jgi:hypothetical protein